MLAALMLSACGSPGERKYEAAPGTETNGPTDAGSDSNGTTQGGDSNAGGTGGGDATGSGDGPSSVNGGGTGGSNGGSGASGGAAGAAGGSATSGGTAGADAGPVTSTTGDVVVPFVPGPPGLDIVTSGARVSSPRFTLVFSVGQSPGGNGIQRSVRYHLASGLVGVAD